MTVLLLKYTSAVEESIQMETWAPRAGLVRSTRGHLCILITSALSFIYVRHYNFVSLGNYIYWMNPLQLEIHEPLHSFYHRSCMHLNYKFKHSCADPKTGLISLCRQQLWKVRNAQVLGKFSDITNGKDDWSAHKFLNNFRKPFPQV